MRVHVRAVVLSMVALVGFVSPGPVRAVAFGDITTFATVPAVPGFPEGVVVHGNRVFVAGPARFGTAGTGPSAIHVYDRRSGTLVDTIVVAGEFLPAEHVVSNMAVDASGRIYALSTQLGLIRFTKQGRGYVQEPYGARLPELPPCPAAAACSPTPFDLPPLGNDVVFDGAGFAYVTDSFQATIFRYPPGGGAAQIWFQAPQLVGGGPLPFGANGIRFDPARQHAYVAVSTSAANPALGTIYRIPLVAAPAPGDIQIFHQYVAGEAPDQLAFGSKGDLYVSLAAANQVSVLSHDGTERVRLQSAAGDDTPLDAPAGLAFDSRTRSLLIVNHALFTGNPAHFAVLRAFVGDPGDPLVQPALP
jgi:sugar lactone lactonase YvrE